MLRGPRARQQLVVSAELEDQRFGDGTRLAKYESLDPAIADVSATGLITPKSDGATTIRVQWRGQTENIAVVVRDAAQEMPAEFRTDVMAALSRAGCSQGACHGSPQGKGGFRLSLRGFDPDLDIQTLTREGKSRRTNPFRPDQSLILLKGTVQLPHRGGLRFQTADPIYQTLRSWIAAGCLDRKDARTLTNLEVLPNHRTLHTESPQQQLLALAHFSDGSVEDVSSHAVFSTQQDPAYTLSDDGLVEFKRTAEATILVRYLQQVRSVRLTYVRTDPAFTFQPPPSAEPNSAGEIDRLIQAKQRQLQLASAPLAADAVFLRRVYLDLLGAIPTPEEASEFIDSAVVDKRSRLIDRLLEREEFANFWAMKWADIMRGNRITISQRGVHGLHRYLVDHFAADRPFDQLAREIVLSQGNTLHKPAASFYRIASTPDEAAESFAQLFLGVRMQCAKCHNHPFESLTQTDYYGLASYFARVKLKGKQFGLDDEIVYLDRQGEVQNPLTKKNAEPLAFGTATGKFEPEEDRRLRLADWLSTAENPYFARSTVNRIWYHVMGRGLVDPVDDFRETNPPSHPELLDALAREFVRGGYRFKPLLRQILNSTTYQLDAALAREPSPHAANPERYFTKAHVRMLTAEQAIDGISSATGLPELFRGYPRGMKAVELAEGAVENHFLMAFTRPLRDTTCDCAREEEPNLSESLHLLNNHDLVKNIESPQGRLGKLLAQELPTAEIVETMYLSTLTRRPTPAEHKFIEEHIQSLGKRSSALYDLQHALLNCNEFLLRH